jgi:hypothetical protein
MPRPRKNPGTMMWRAPLLARSVEYESGASPKSRGRGVSVGVLVGVSVGVLVGVSVGVSVGVGVGASIVTA